MSDDVSQLDPVDLVQVDDGELPGMAEAPPDCDACGDDGDDEAEGQQ